MMKGSLSPSPPPSLPLLPSTYNDVLNQDTSRLITTNIQFTDILAILTTAVTKLSHDHNNYYTVHNIWGVISAKTNQLYFGVHSILCMSHFKLCMSHSILCMSYSKLCILHYVCLIPNYVSYIMYVLFQIMYLTLCMSYSKLCILHYGMYIIYARSCML